MSTGLAQPNIEDCFLAGAGAVFDSGAALGVGLMSASAGFERGASLSLGLSAGPSKLRITMSVF